MPRCLRLIVNAGLVLALFGWVAAPLQAQENKDEANVVERAKLQKQLIGRLRNLIEAKGGAVDKLVPGVLKDLKRYLAKTEMDVQQFQLANVTARVLETKGQYKASLKLRRELKDHFSKAKNKRLSKAAEEARQSAEKRLGVIGKPLQLEGNLVDGSSFGWKQYKGKVVLVDFWATWCRPCLEELPNVMANYKKYHERGFEVVGVSLDDDAEKLKTFIKEAKIPWKNLFPKDQINRGWENPLAVKFGISSIPFTMLVNREGKVVALNISGEALGEQLEKLLAKKTADGNSSD